jgi:hypothetical protein
LEIDMDNLYVSYRYFTMVLLLERVLTPLLPSTTQKLDIHSYNVLLSCIAYTKQLLFSLFPYSSFIEISDSSNPPSTPLLLDLSIDTSSLPFVGMPAEPLPEFGTFVVSNDTLSVVIVSSQIISYVACQ